MAVTVCQRQIINVFNKGTTVTIPVSVQLPPTYLYAHILVRARKMMAACCELVKQNCLTANLLKQPMQVPPTSVFFVVVEMEDALHKVLVKHGRVACEEKVPRQNSAVERVSVE